MNIAHASSYNFTDKRAKKESSREFITQFFDSGHVEMIMEMAYEMNMSVEDATAHALAMFNSIQDLFYFHHNFDLGELNIATVRTNTGGRDITSVKDVRRIMRYREFLKEPYLSNRLKMTEQVLRYLKGQENNKDRLAEGVPIANPERYFKKREKLFEKNKEKRIAKYSKEAKKKRKRLKKLKQKNWGWTKEV